MPEQETSAAPSIPALSRDRPIALSYAQDRYWLLSLVEPSSTVYHVTAAVRLRGPLQVSTLRAALSALVQRHEALRTVVGVVDGKPVQRILPKVDLPLQEDDFSKHADPEAAVRAAIAALAQIPFDLTQDLLIRARLARLSAADHVLIFSVHRMAADETSLAILWRDFGVLYSNQLSPRSQELPELAISLPISRVGSATSPTVGDFSRTSPTGKKSWQGSCLYSAWPRIFRGRPEPPTPDRPSHFSFPSPFSEPSTIFARAPTQICFRCSLPRWPRCSADTAAWMR